jgi:hypothetical protein
MLRRSRTFRPTAGMGQIRTSRCAIRDGRCSSNSGSPGHRRTSSRMRTAPVGRRSGAVGGLPHGLYGLQCRTGWLFLNCNSATTSTRARTFDLFGPMTLAHGCKCRTHPTGGSANPLFFLGSIRALRWRGNARGAGLVNRNLILCSFRNRPVRYKWGRWPLLSYGPFSGPSLRAACRRAARGLAPKPLANTNISKQPSRRSAISLTAPVAIILSSIRRKHT